MYNEPEEMRKLHEIRAKHYEETKNMVVKERIERTHNKAEEIIKKYV